MSMKRRYNPNGIPARWLNCPRKGLELIVDKFLPFKVPLSSRYDDQVPLANRFSMAMLLESAKKTFGNKKIGFIVDLTNTDRFYDAESEVKSLRIKHCQLRCRGHGETPSPDHSTAFINLVETFISQHPTELIGVHCTHGFNRTGFMICSYLVERLDMSIDVAIMMFAQARPPGIYKQDYINELFKRYDPTGTPLPAPGRPDWEDEDEGAGAAQASASAFFDEDAEEEEDEVLEEESSSQNGQEAKKKGPRVKRAKGVIKMNAAFAEPGLEGVETCTDHEEILRVQRLSAELCEWKRSDFPGAQPVSMDQRNIMYLHTHRYMVSWKADGTRYLMLINGRDKIYMFDRDNTVFKINNLTFLHRKDFSRHLENTLLDGEFVMDLDPATNQKIPRFLIYDVIHFESDKVGKMSFDIRLKCIDKEIIFARSEAMRAQMIDRRREPFSVRQKQFWPLLDTKKLLSPEFEKQISHGIDGLIFQPVDMAYVGGRCDFMLKWKPPTMNSVDFRLSIREFQEIGGLPEKIGELWVNGYDQPFSRIKITKKISPLNGKIIECNWVQDTPTNGHWDFMRERVDKSYPNHFSTATAVCESIRHPITAERLLSDIVKISQAPRPPPNHLQAAPPAQAQPTTSSRS